MESFIRTLKKSEVFGLLYLASFLLAFHLFFVIYIHSSFLNTFIAERYVGTIWILGSVLGVGALLLASRALKRFGNYRVLVFLTLLEFLIFIGLAFVTKALFALPLFILYLIIYPVILFNLDIFLESYTKEESATGSIRGTILTVVNTALIIAPLLAGLILTDGDYWKVYLIAAFFLIPFLYLISKLRSFVDPPYRTLHIWPTLLSIWNNKNIYSIFMAQFVLRFFFAWMVIYMPIYLHVHIGFSWSEIGVMFAIMLLPFALLELPAGKIADTWLGEKEILSAGFLIAAFFTVLISFITSNNFFIWTATLFMIRVGASLIEIMTESYFFKHVQGDDNSIISFFRITRPVAYIIGPIVASIALIFIDLRFIFIILSLVLLSGLFYSFRIEDTK